MEIRKLIRNYALLLTLTFAIVLLSMICIGNRTYAADEISYQPVNAQSSQANRLSTKSLIANIPDEKIKKCIKVTAIDLLDYSAIDQTHLDDSDFLYFAIDHDYEIRLTYDFTNQLDLANARIRFSVPKTITATGALHWGKSDMYLYIDSLNGRPLVSYKIVLYNENRSEQSITVTSAPAFYNKSYPDSIELSDQFFTDGIILDDIADVNFGYISFTVSTRATTSASDSQSTEDSADDSWMPIFSIIVLAVALAAVVIGNLRLKREREKLR